jgi:hypothetical protein
MRRLLLALFLLGCTEPAPPPVAPDWTAVPAGALDALCARLQMDAIATGAPLTVVSTTRPLATPQSLHTLTLTTRGRTTSVGASEAVALMNRSLPVTTDGTSCAWRPIAASQLAQHQDEMVLELSAPALHPFSPKEAGLFARVTVGGQGASWYWIHLAPSPVGWRIASVSVLVQ